MLNNEKAFHRGMRDYMKGLPKQIPYSGKDLEDYIKGHKLAHRIMLSKFRKEVKDGQRNF